MKTILTILLVLSSLFVKGQAPKDTTEVERVIKPVEFLIRGDSTYKKGFAVISIRKENTKILFYVTADPDRKIINRNTVVAINK